MDSPIEATLKLEPLSRANWEAAAALTLSEDQRDFIPPNLWSIAQSKVEALFPYALVKGKTVVGFAMYGDFGGICWISRIMVGQEYQGNGYGRGGLALLLEIVKAKGSCKEIRTSVSKDNALAEYLFYGAGFRRIGDAIDNEIVMRLTR